MFLALDLGEEARKRLVRWRDLLVEGRSDVRPVRAEALHVTLVFLGWQDELAAGPIAEAAFAALPPGPAPRLAARGVRSVPPRDARLFALDLKDDGGRAGALQGAMAAVLETGGYHKPERRPFWPHITLARVKRGERRVPPLPDVPDPPAEPFDAQVVTLYRSTLRPQGAVYEPLARTVAKNAPDSAPSAAAD
jgi:2'-5' RNA ligase